MLDAIWECLLPGIGCRASTRDDEILAGRLRGLSLPLVSGSASPERSVTATLDASAEGSALPDGTTVTVVPPAVPGACDSGRSPISRPEDVA